MTTRQTATVFIIAFAIAAVIAFILIRSALQPPLPPLQKPLASFPQGMMQLSSPAFGHTQAIPALYTCDGSDIHPELSIANVSPDAASLALIVDDPDAPRGDWVHWTVWNIPTSTTVIEEGKRPAGVEGLTDFGRAGWGGPCPPSGTHRYQFKLYALDIMLDIHPTSTKSDLEKAMKGHILDQALLIGTYTRK
ncbi:MAG: UPF0098 protein [Candidatus Uhrbacteria bacterium]